MSETLFARLRMAYMRGAAWRDENGSLDLVEKAAYDYADKETSPPIENYREPGEFGEGATVRRAEAQTASRPVSAIETIEKAMEGVTPGPWQTVQTRTDIQRLTVAGPSEIVCGLDGICEPDRMNDRLFAEDAANMRYIAACHPVAMREVLALARQAEALQRENAELREALKPFADVVERAETAAEYFGACHVEEVDDSRPYGLTGTTWGDLRRARALLGGENAE